MKKITCWMYSYAYNGVVLLAGVNAATRKDAVETLRLGGFSVVDPQEVKPVTILEGHEHFPDAEKYAWYDEDEVST